MFSSENSVESSVEESDALQNQDNLDEQAVSLDESQNDYYRINARAGMHYFNQCIAFAGNRLLNSYNEQKNSIIGSSGWFNNDETNAEYHPSGNSPRVGS